MKKISLTLFILLVVLLFVSCSGENKLDYATFLTLLTENDFDYNEDDGRTAAGDFLSVASNVIQIDDESLSVFEYASNRLMESDAKRIDPSGFSITFPDRGINTSWASTPYFFKKDRIIILYVGTNERIINFLKDNLGEPFAGGLF